MTVSRPLSVAAAGALVVLGSLRCAAAGELTGRLLLGDRPAAGVTVCAVPYEPPLDQARREARRLPPSPPLASATTRSDGGFVLAIAAEAGKETLFTVRAEGGGAVAGSVAGVWDAAEIVDLGDVVLRPGTRLGGKVVDATGAPVGDAEVVLLPQDDRTDDADFESAPRFARTAADGAFHFDDASAVGDVLKVEKPGLLAARRTGIRARASIASIVLTPGVPVRGIVRGTDRTSPAAGALVRIEGRITTRWVEAGRDGSFSIPDAPPGTVTVVADAGEAGYIEQPGVRLPLAPGAALTLVLQPPSTLAGRTVDAKTGRPVPRTRVDLRAGGETRTARARPDGTYAFRALPPRSWRLRADEPRYVRWTRESVPVRPGETKKLDVPLVLGASLSGRVADESGLPVGGAKGVLTLPGSSTIPRLVRRFRGNEPPAFRTRPDGTFKATRLTPGQGQVLSVSHPAYERATLGGISLVPGATKAGVAVVLKRGTIVAGVVKDGEGRPVPGVAVDLSQPLAARGPRGALQAITRGEVGLAAGGRSATTADDGTFSIRGVAPGEYVLTAKRAGYATQHVEGVRVEETRPPRAVEVTLQPGVSISGRLVRRTGTGAEGLLVFVLPQGRLRGGGGGNFAPDDQPTGPDGVFSIGELEAGQRYDVQILGPSGPIEGKRGVTAPASDLEITVAGLGRVTGTALDARDRHALAEFQVAYEPDRGGPAQRLVASGAARIAGLGTGAGGPGQPVDVNGGDGTFALEDVPAGTWSVVVTAPGYQPARAAGVTVEEGSTRAGVEVRVTRGASVKGRVVDAQTGASVANALVSLGPTDSPLSLFARFAAPSGGEAATDADGRFEMDGIAPGRQSLRVTHPDYTEATTTVQVNEDGTSAEIRLSPGGAVAGTVVSDAGQPVPGADVALSEAGSGGGPGPLAFLGGQSNLTDAAGQFRFDHLGPGRYTATALLNSLTSAPAEVVLQAGQSQESIVLQLQTGITVQGTVSGLPDAVIKGVSVSANGENSYFQNTIVGAQGRFEFDNVPPGVVTLRGTATDSPGSTRSVTKQVIATADQPVLTTELVFDQGYTLSGQVSRTGQPVAGANVFATLQGGGGRQASAVTNDGGTYQLSGLQEGTYVVNATSAFAGAGTSKRQMITIASDQTLDIVFPGSRIAGQVVDAAGKTPIADATVAIAAQDPRAGGGIGQRPSTTDSSGRFSFSDLDEGTYALSTSKPDFELDKRAVAASDQETGDLVIALKRGAGIGIQARDGLSGVPLRGVMVRVFDTQDSPVLGPSPIALDGEGQGEIPSLAPGAYSVLASASGYAAVRLDGVIVPSSGVVLSFTPGGTVVVRSGPGTLASGTAAGTIATAAGRPALLSIMNPRGRVAISEPNLELRNVPVGSYVLSLPTVPASVPFTVTEGASTVIQLP